MGKIIDGKFVPDKIICSRCKIEQTELDFDLAKDKATGLQSHCRNCAKIAKDRNKEIEWEHHLWRTYGLTADQYFDKLKEQNGVCEICQKVDASGIRLSVDHCDTSKINRGLLCMNCNNGLGRFEHNPELLRAAADYIEKWHPAKVKYCG